MIVLELYSLKKSARPDRLMLVLTRVYDVPQQTFTVGA